MLKDLVIKNRSVRRFYSDQRIPRNVLLELIDLARFIPSAKNLQPLKYFLSSDPETNSEIFPTLSWAGYLKPGGIEIDPQDRPSAYIIILGDKSISANFGIDYGIAAQTILLGAAELGLGGCMIGTIRMDELRSRLELDQKYEILLVIALGKPRESVVIESIKNNDVKYWRSGLEHHVPKRSLSEIVIKKN